MPGADNKCRQKIGRHLLDTYKKPEGITLGKCSVAINVLELITKIKEP